MLLKKIDLLQHQRKKDLVKCVFEENKDELNWNYNFDLLVNTYFYDNEIYDNIALLLQ